jgi:hypothetical protein
LLFKRPKRENEECHEMVWAKDVVSSSCLCPGAFMGFKKLKERKHEYFD